ncbi:DUF2513 domain-containing protein [Sphingobium sp. AS12]|uniref:DUF2513 domain-containing protein n=1 Tax=Sphingobium sp. AS12 TaxID=2849495 RepID=UPI001C3177A4|nr:DUF2513 domain-containing protein [Sphingobium sp. AS12]MBV2147107.1 DUF2513 domain-containing protein [Sphingobium sp. AS12]
MDLIRELLLLIESHPVSDPILTKDICINGYSDVQIGLHINMMNDAGLLVSETANSKTNIHRTILVILIFDLSWKGHDYLSSIRDPAIWKKTKSFAAKAGNSSFELMIEIAKSLAKQALGQLGLPVGN